LERIGITILLLSLCGAHGVSAASEQPCECPKIDTLAKKTECGVRPAGIKNVEPYSEKSCRPPKSVLNEIRAGVSKANQKSAENLSSPVKPKPNWELLDYMSCYRPDTDRFCHYKNTLSKYIEYSAKVSNLSFAVQSCLFLKENSFSTKSSSEGAAGYVQVLPNTIHDMNRILENTVKKYEKILKEKRLNLGTLKRAEDIKHAKAEIVKFRAQLQARKVWDRYWAKTEGAPKSITLMMSKCYRTAFLIAAMKQTYDLYLLSDDVKDFQKDSADRARINGMNAVETGVFLAGAYNQGVGGFANRCRGKKLKACIESYPKDFQTRQQLHGVRNCVQSGSQAQTNQVYAANARRNCEIKRCSK
jgi:hypothetical protein